MKRLIIAFALLTLTPVVSAQIRDGQFFSDGQGTTARASVADTNGSAPGGVVVQIVDHTGFTSAVPAYGDGPTAGEFAPVQTQGGNWYRGRSIGDPTYCNLQKKNSEGKWVNMKKINKPRNWRKPRTPQRAEAGGGLQIGEEGTSVPMPLAPKPL